MPTKVIGVADNEKKFSVKKLILFLAVIILPIIVVMVVFIPFNSERIPDLNLSLYEMSDLSNKDAFQKILDSMKGDAEFQFYFDNLDKIRLSAAALEVYDELKGCLNKECVRGVLDQQQKMAESQASLFFNIEYDQDFTIDIVNPSDQELVLWAFLSSEFKAAITGLIYKANFDNTFAFQWSKESVLAAKKLKDLIMQLQLRLNKP